MKCPYCGAEVFQTPDGELVCANGHVIEDSMVDVGPEWRSYDDSAENRVRVTAVTPLATAEGLYTKVVAEGRGGKRIYSEKLARLQTKMLDEKFSRERRVLELVKEYTSLLNVPRYVAESAAEIARKLIAMQLAKNRSDKLLAATAVYTAIRLNNYSSIGIKDVAKVTGIEARKIGRFYTRILQRTGIKTPLPSHNALIEKLVNELKLPPITSTIATMIVKAGKDALVFQGSPPSAVTATAVYVAAILANARVTKHQVAEKAGVSEQTIRNKLKKLVKRVEIEVLL